MPADKVDILILGAGWTSTFLIPLCEERQISYAATSRNGREGTTKFVFDAESDDAAPFSALPDAGTVLIVFPIRVSGASERLVRHFQKTHEGTEAGFVQLGSTGIWDNGPTAKKSGIGRVRSGDMTWYDRHSEFDASNPRANAENELLALSPDTPTTVLNLCGLWGGSRHVRNWVGRVAPTKEALKAKGSIHMIHGADLARAILAVHCQFDKTAGQRWLLTDQRVYDWWDLASAWGSDGEHSDKAPQSGWVRELMDEEGIRALPRSAEEIGRALDSREFWKTFGLSPVRARLE
ncbi:hypothetical protein OE88DRAFT_1713474 [Heliocybe sulcata]|uniref:NAD(P)-binding protein n=1 Tax=Heliocybe sulcata TaxID=5364 RepID=A0A5C3MY81_9AGAM|nr:hypothetical protein OE88DRAFT_1713474 [Heliocybe sulcata]